MKYLGMRMFISQTTGPSFFGSDVAKVVGTEKCHQELTAGTTKLPRKSKQTSSQPALSPGYRIDGDHRPFLYGSLCL